MGKTVHCKTPHNSKLGQGGIIGSMRTAFTFPMYPQHRRTHAHCALTMAMMSSGVVSASPLRACRGVPGWQLQGQGFRVSRHVARRACLAAWTTSTFRCAKPLAIRYRSKEVAEALDQHRQAWVRLPERLRSP